MTDWLHHLPVMDGTGGLVAAAISAVVTILAVGERARSFKAISAGMLSPLGIIFGLFVVFTAVQVWQDNERANREVRAMRGSSDLIELNGDDLRCDPLNVRKAGAVEPRPRRFKFSPGLASVRHRGPDLDRANSAQAIQGSVSAQRSVSCIIAPQL